MGDCCCKQLRSAPSLRPTDEAATNLRTPRCLKRTKSTIDPKSKLTPYREVPTATPMTEGKSQSDVDLIRKALLQHTFFRESPTELVNLIADAMVLFLLDAGETVYQEKEMSQYFFVMASGKVEMQQAGKRVSEVNNSGRFGQDSFLSETPRRTTVKTAAKTKLWGLHRTVFNSIIKQFEESQAVTIHRFLESANLFQGLSPKDIEALPRVMKLRCVQPGTVIVRQGEPGSSCFFVKTGVVACSKNQQEVRRLGPGELFGEQALLYGGLRTATVRSVTEVSLWSIERDDLITVLGDNLDRVIYKNTVRIAFDKSPLLSRLSEKQREKVISRIQISTSTTGAVAIPNKSDDPMLWVVVDGFLEARDNLEQVLQPFTIVGDKAETWGKSRTVGRDYIVGSDSASVACISISALERRLGGPIQSCIGSSPTLPAMMRIPLFLQLSTATLNAFVKQAVVRSFSTGQVIVSQNDRGSTVFVIQSGEVEISRDGGVVRSLGLWDYFGERGMLWSDKRTATVAAKGEVVCWLFEKQNVMQAMGEGVRDRMEQRIALQDDPTTIADLIVIKTVAKGVFGTVFLTMHSTKFTFYALRVVCNTDLSEDGMQSLHHEKQLLMRLYHPFLLKFVRVTTDTDFTYFLSVFINGTDLFEVLRDFGRVLTDGEAKFYIACLTLTLEYLHSHKVLYRNVKPENVLIDESGYPVLVDVNKAKVMTEEKTYTIVGDPHYLAPEVIKRGGYSFPSDYWSLGIILYESLCGQVPFGEHEDSPYKVYESILEGELVFPDVTLANVYLAKDVIVSLLNPNPALRLHSSLAKFRKNPWFKSISWVSCR